MSPADRDGLFFPRLLRVRRKVQETHDTFTLELAAARKRDGRPFAPGQFNMLYVFGVGEVPISISSDPGEPEALKHTTREVGNVTRAMRALEAGAMIGVRGPFGVPWPIAQCAGRDVVLIAGGIGLAPLRSALYRLAAERGKYGKVVLLYGTRTPNDILFKEELEAWRAGAGVEVRVTVDRSLDSWEGQVGVVTALIPRAPFDPARTVAMICGPEIMMRLAARELEQRGVRPRDIYLSLERNMKCGIGHCGHCQCGPVFVCKDGPVFAYDRIRPLLTRAEL
jgi:NAD(P)H-flavin reductase